MLAHQGGWDEVLFVAAPCALFVWLLRLARKRSLAARPPADPSGPLEDSAPHKS